MAYRKFTADRIFTGYEMLSDAEVLVTDEKGKIVDIMPKNETADDVQELHGIITPGLINCHCHLELSHLKGAIPPGTGMVKFLLSVMGSRNHSPEAIRRAISDAEKNMADSGIVAIGDICNTGHTVLQKQEGNIFYRNFIEATGFVEATAGLRFGQALEVYDAFKRNASIVPHAPYSVSNNLFELITKHDPGSLLSIHNQESHAENELFTDGSGDFLDLYKTLRIDISDFRSTGKTSIQSYLGKISGDHSLILVHNTVTSADDVNWLLNNQDPLPKLYWCLCPNANLYINNMLADVKLLQASGYKIVIGTDSLASNHQLNIIDELRTLQQQYPELTTAELLRFATINGAEALRISEQYGSFEKDKTPGIVLIEGVENDSLAGATSKKIL